MTLFNHSKIRSKQMEQTMNQDAIDRIKALDWYHKIDLGGGIVTPGYNFDALWNAVSLEMDGIDYRGKKVLDIGTWDGKWAFEAEKRGAAEVWATDFLTIRPVSGRGNETFELAKELLNSGVHFKECSVYDCDKSFEPGYFDIIQFFGVLYHLRYPLLALAKLRKTLKDTGIVLIETAVILDSEDSIIQTDFRKIYQNDISTWNAFSEKALCNAVSESYFNLECYKVIRRQDEVRKIGRAFVKATATRGKHYHHYFPYPELEVFFEPTK